MKVIENNILPPKGYKAITLGNCIFVRKGTQLGVRTMRHEEIHWAQEKELLIIGFYLLYVLEFFVRLIQCRKWKEAYHCISFEREAYTNQRYPKYLKYRKHYAWRRYL